MNTAYTGFRDARDHLKPILDVAGSGRMVTVTRGDQLSAVVSGEQLRRFLDATVQPRARVVMEDGAFAVFIPGVPVAAEATSFADAVDEMTVVLRDYAEDWEDHLYGAPNHADNWGLVNLVRLSSDDQLRAWLVGDGR
ncbi:hypothetical protein [Cellulomonas bogoriensis]|uniref:hypothetical protein n=1 Tax=Cellulomonas bogoriensis TaxID=301388 RepID=UPI0018DC3EE8|nr:hypothetical protein [Cellulomonas bogoriensis]